MELRKDQGAKVTKIGVEDIETADVTSEEGKEIEASQNS